VPVPIVSGNKIDLSNQVMQFLVQRKYAALESQMNATVSSQVSLDRLQGLWDGLAPQIGSYKRMFIQANNQHGDDIRQQYSNLCRAW
jgi:hypothetical protein